MKDSSFYSMVFWLMIIAFSACLGLSAHADRQRCRERGGIMIHASWGMVCVKDNVLINLER